MAEQAGGNQRKITAVLASIGIAILAKLKWVIGLLKFTKFGTTFLSLIVSLGSYALFYGWKFGVVLIYLIFVHEMGHLVAARQKGIKTSPAVFIPFVGAMISMKERPQNAATEAYLAYGGPLAGLLSFLPAIPLYFLTHNPVWGLMIFLGAVLNLFNLLPVSPLDGGRIVTVLSTKIWLIGLVLLAVLVFFNHSPIMILILIIGFFSWWGRARESYKAEGLSYRKERHREYIRSLRDYLDELFFMRVDEDGSPEPVLISEMRLFRLREVRNRAEQLKERLQDASSFAIPFLQDEKKLKKERLLIDLEYEKKTEYFLDGESTEYDVLKHRISEAEKQVLLMDKELERLKTYYKAPASTKVKVLILYIGLAAVLSFFYFYGQQIANIALF
ncbi:MAG TPA: site-2 protease family protein [Bacillales bacterium]|nr:site-2 protease family protein [Bacillales bacterium]